MELSDDGETAVLSATDQFALFRPKVYIYVRQGGTWPRQAELIPDTGALSASVALSGDGNEAITGALGISCLSTNETAIAHRFSRNDGTWKEEQALLLPTPGFGSSATAVDLTARGDLAVVGAFESCIGAAPVSGARVAFAFASAAAVPGIPALSGPGLLALALALATGGAVLLRRRVQA
ncbi:MAG TPA: hypothetical protein VGG03_07685 [Thermoanaerobaculia bacterium]|jgi:hypothetical protein